MTRDFRWYPSLLALALAVSLSGQNAWAAYRWVDEDGVTHYSDQVPPDQAKHRRSKLDQQGREVAVIKTPEQLRQEQLLRELRYQQEKVLAEQKEQDLLLLRTYRSEDDLRRVLKNKLDTLDAALRAVDGNRQSQQTALTGLEQRAAETERQGQAVPQNLRNLITTARRQLTDSEAKIQSLNADRKTLEDRFAKDIARYKAIVAEQKRLEGPLGANPSAAPDKVGINDSILGTVPCGGATSCDRAWELAKGYLLKHAGPVLSLESEKVLQTPAPTRDGEFSMTVTRIRGKAEDTLFLDMNCQPSPAGEALCTGLRIQEIRAGFRPYIEAGLAAGGGKPAAQGAR